MDQASTLLFCDVSAKSAMSKKWCGSKIGQVDEVEKEDIVLGRLRRSRLLSRRAGRLWLRQAILPLELLGLDLCGGVCSTLAPRSPL
jgi:hypothetical protein